MNLSYYNAKNFPLLLDMYKQSCEQVILLNAEYVKNDDANTLKQLKLSVRNSVEIYNKIISVFNEKGSMNNVKSDYFNRKIGKRPGVQGGRTGEYGTCEYHACS